MDIGILPIKAAARANAGIELANRIDIKGCENRANRGILWGKILSMCPGGAKQCWKQKELVCIFDFHIFVLNRPQD